MEKITYIKLKVKIEVSIYEYIYIYIYIYVSQILLIKYIPLKILFLLKYGVAHVSMCLL